MHGPLNIKLVSLLHTYIYIYIYILTTKINVFLVKDRYFRFFPVQDCINVGISHLRSISIRFPHLPQNFSI